MSFEINGYKKYDVKIDHFGTTSYFQRRVDTDDGFDYPLCQCNNKVYINLTHGDFVLNDTPHVGCKLSLVHENGDGEWCDLSVYSLTEEELTVNIAKYETRLLEMWKVFNQ